MIFIIVFDTPLRITRNMKKYIDSKNVIVYLIKQ